LLFRPKVPLSRLRTERGIGAVYAHRYCIVKENEWESTHSWIPKFFYKVFTMGANWADEIGQIEAILVTQSSGYQSEELGVSYGHESQH